MLISPGLRIVEYSTDGGTIWYQIGVNGSSGTLDLGTVAPGTPLGQYGSNIGIKFRFSYDPIDEADDKVADHIDLSSTSGSAGAAYANGQTIYSDVLCDDTDGNPLGIRAAGPVNGTSGGTYNFYVRGWVTDGVTVSYSCYRLVTIKVSGAVLTLSPAPPATITNSGGNGPVVGSNFISNQINIVNGIGPYVITAAGLPAGMSLSATTDTPGTVTTTITTSSQSFYIVGSPTASGTSSSIAFTVSDQSSTPATVVTKSPYTLVVTSSGGGTLLVAKASQTPAVLKQGQTMTITFTASGGDGNYTFSTPSTVPSGLTFSSSGNTGILTGIPIEGTDKIWSAFRVNAVDNHSVTGYLLIDFEILASAWIDGLSPTGGTVNIFPDATIGTPYSKTITARGGSGGSYQIHFNSCDVAHTTFLQDTGIPNLTLQGSVSNDFGSEYVSTSTATFSGTPTGAPTNNPRVFRYWVVAATTGGGSVTSPSLAYEDTVNVSGASQLSIAETLAGATLNQGEDTALVGTYVVSGPGTGAFTWSITPTSGSGAGVFTLSSTTGSSVTVLFNGVANPTKFGTFGYNLLVTRASGETGTKAVSYSVAGKIHYTGTFPTSVSQNQDISVTDLVFYGGSNGTFTYTVQTKANWITIQQLGTGNNTLRFSGQPNEATGAHVLTFKMKENTSQVETFFSISYTVTGGNIIISPYGGLNLCPHPLDPTGPNGGLTGVTLPTAIVGADCSNGTYTITPSGGTLNHAGPYISGERPIWTAPSGTPAAYTLLYTSVVDGGVTVTQTITVTAGDLQLGLTTIAPDNVVTMYSGEQKTFTASTHFPGCVSPINCGTWSFISSLDYGCVNYPPIGASTQVTAPGGITTARVAQMLYQSIENPEYNAAYVGIFLLPGVNTGFTLTSSETISGTEEVSLNFTFTYSGSVTLPLYFELIDPDKNLPDGLSLSPSGTLSGTPHQSSSGWYITVVVHDSSPTAKWTGGLFKLVIASAGGGGTPTLASINPSSGPTAGGTHIQVNGTNLGSGDEVSFAFGSPASVFRGCSGYSYSGIPSYLTCYTPPAIGAGAVAAGIARSGYTYGWRTSAFLYSDTGGDLSALSCNPTSVVIGYGSNLSVVIAGTGFNSSCTVTYNPNTPSHPTDIGVISSTVNSGNSITAILPTTYFSDPSYVGNSPVFTVHRASDGATAPTPNGAFRVRPLTLDIITTQSTFTDGTRSSPYGPVFAEAAGGDPGTSGYSWSLAGTYLPDGLYLYNYGASGYVYGGISGTPTVTSVSKNFTLRVTDSVAAVKDKPFTISIVGGDPSITTTSVPDATIGQAYSTTLLVSGGTSPFTWQVVNGALPNGLTLATDTGVISGVPATQTAPSTWNFTVQVTDDGAKIATKTLSMALNAAPTPVSIISINPTFGPLSGGTVVALTGTGFKNNCGVKFGTVAATATTFVTDTLVRAIAPAKGTAGVVNVTITNTDGGTASYASFEYKDIKTPIITGLDKRDGPFAGGQAVRLYGQNFSGITWVRFNTTSDAAAEATIVNNNTTVLPNQLDILTPQGFQFSPDAGATALAVNIYANNVQGIGSLDNVENWYTYRPPPIITAVVPNSGPTSGGQAVYVLGRNFFQRGDTFKPRVFIGNVEVSAENVRLVEEE
jgi:hypothetical protein